MSCNVTDEQFDAFVRNTSDALVDHVATCDECRSRMDAMTEPPRDIADATMRAVRFHRAGREMGELIVDLGVRFSTALLTYTGRTQ